MKKLISLLLVLLLAASALAAVAEAAQWTCPGCGAVNDGNFCMECGTPRPAQVVCPGCVRYGDVWTMYGPGLLAAILGISVDRQAFAAVDEIG